MNVTLYVILNWDRFYENAASRKLHHLAWFACPTKQDGEGYQDLHENHDDGTAHFGAFMAIVELAAKTQPREARWSGCLVKNDGTPHDARSLSRKTHVRKEIIQAALDRLVTEIGWFGKVLVDSQRLMDIYRNKPRELPTLVAESANEVADDRQSNHATGTTGTIDNTEKDGSPPVVLPPGGHETPSQQIADLLERLRAGLPRVSLGLTAGEFQTQVEGLLSGLGLSVRREVRVEDRGDGRPGKLDLVADGHGLKIALELDRLEPREKSLWKLRRFDGVRVVVLRERGYSGDTPEGIDAVIGPSASTRGKPKPSWTDEQIRAIYLPYPRKAKPRAAYKAIRGALARLPKELKSHGLEIPEDLHAWLLERTKLFAASPLIRGKLARGAKRYVDHPATWFNGGGYLEDPETWKEDEGGRKGVPQGEHKGQAAAGRGGEAARTRRTEKTAREGGAQEYIDPV